MGLPHELQAKRVGCAGRPETVIEPGGEQRYRQHGQGGDGQHAGEPGGAVVDARGDAGLMVVHRVHHHRGERRHADGHADAHDHDAREPVDQVTAFGAGHCQHGEACPGDGGSCREHLSGRPSADQVAGECGADAQQQGHRQQRQAGLEGRVALYLNQVERQEVQHSAQGPVEEQSHQIGAGEVAAAEQLEGQHGVARAPLALQEGGAKEQRCRQPQPGFVAGRPQQRQDQQAERRGQQQPAGIVRPGAQFEAVPGNPPQGQADGGQRDRRHHQEHALPAEGIHQPTAQDRTGRGGEGGCPCPGADGLAAGPLVEVAADQGQAHRHQRGGAQPLNDTE
jgi:hypothetical protein